MELQAAHQIIDTLAQGIHPVTGEAMPEDSPYNAPRVIRALFAVSQALQGKAARVRRGLPPQRRQALGAGRRRQAGDGIRRRGGVAPAGHGPGPHAFCGGNAADQARQAAAADGAFWCAGGLTPAEFSAAADRARRAGRRPAG